MTDPRLTEIRDLIQEDVGERGLAADPTDNLLTACPNDFAAACQSLAGTTKARVVVVTGFYIAHAQLPCAETDGPLGAIFLARALVPLGIEVVLATDGYCIAALHASLEACDLSHSVRLFDFDAAQPSACLDLSPTHVIALERVGPSHTTKSLEEQSGASEDQWFGHAEVVPWDKQNRCYSMRGRDLTAQTAPAHWMFERAMTTSPRITTIGIGDGGNEIGMGKIRWDTIRRNINNGGLIACRVPTDHLIVCGISNWGAYALAAGVRLLRGAPHDPELFDVERERRLLEIMVRDGPLVDGKTGERTATVDGIPFDRYAAVLTKLEQIISTK